MFRQGVREYKARAGILLTLILLFSLPISPATAAAPGGDPVAFLTFDCEGGGVPQVLTTLEAEHVNAMMFLVGSWALAHPALVRRMVADGDALGTTVTVIRCSRRSAPLPSGAKSNRRRLPSSAPPVASHPVPGSGFPMALDREIPG
jgi:hypothetical protein